MVKVQGQNSNRNVVKWTAKNGQKVSDDKDAAGNTSLVPGVKSSKLRTQSGLEFDQAYAYWVYYGRSPTKWFRLIMNMHMLNHSRVLAWLRGGTTDMTNIRSPFCQFFFLAVCLTTFPFEFQPRTFTIKFFKEKNYQIRAMTSCL